MYDQTGSSEINAGARLHPKTDVGTVTLKVADLERSLAFYRDSIGLSILERSGGSAWLGAGGRKIMRLEEVPGARAASPRSTGLYHSAILFPDRSSLAIKIAQLANAGLSIGQGDHLVSEAFYLTDPDGNGLELYRDRPRSEWQWEGNTVRMASDPVDVQGMFAEIGDKQALRNPSAPDGTRLGHIHLRVADVAEAERFYVGVLGFDVMARWPGALFVSAGGYHHHFGLNAWQSRGGRPGADDEAGLRAFSLLLPDQAELDRLVRQVEAAGVAVERADGSVALVRDPFENTIQLTVAR